MTYSTEIRGMRQLQRRYLQAIRSLRVETGIGRAVRRIILRSHRVAVNITHVDTGSLRSSHIVDLVIRGMQAVGTLYISRETVNPKHGERPYRYGIEEHDRGGEHSFYQRTFFDETVPAARDALRLLQEDFDEHFRGIPTV